MNTRCLLLVAVTLATFPHAALHGQQPDPSPAASTRGRHASELPGKREPSPRIVNIVNFVRQCEPRIEWITEDVLYETVVEQIRVMRAHQLRGTFLLQYDALVDVRYQELMKSLPAEAFEVGAWWEIPQPLVEDAGLTWRGRYPWDWHADVGFATGYTPEEREQLTDTYMAAFEKAFGRRPASVGSWFIDAHTLRYMHERYGIVASCNCKDQIGTDGYTLWGGYWNQAYYPSVKNAYMPAQHAANQIRVPVFRMLGSDPIHQYDSGLGTQHQPVISLEPIYDPGGANPTWCRWYFDAFVDGEAMDYAYTQVGQENSFTWRRMERGFTLQMEMIDRLRTEGKVAVMTLGEAGRWFRDRYEVTPPTSVTVLNDHSKKDLKTVWFDSRFWRANLLWEDGTLRFRDVHLFDERVASAYLEAKGTSTQCRFITLPLVDGFLWSTGDHVAGLRLKTRAGTDVRGGTPVVEQKAPGELSVRWSTHDPKGELLMTFDERGMTLAATGDLRGAWVLELDHAEGAPLPFESIEPTCLACRTENVVYEVHATHGSFHRKGSVGWLIEPDAVGVRLDLSRR